MRDDPTPTIHGLESAITSAARARWPTAATATLRVFRDPEQTTVLESSSGAFYFFVGEPLQQPPETLKPHPVRVAADQGA